MTYPSLEVKIECVCPACKKVIVIDANFDGIDAKYDEGEQPQYEVKQVPLTCAQPVNLPEQERPRYNPRTDDPNNIKDFWNWVTWHRMNVFGFPMAISQTGEPYTEFKSGFSRTQAGAEGGLVWNMVAHIKANDGVVYWRIKPEVDFGETDYRSVGAGDKAEKGFHAYARLLVSDAPIRWKTYADYERETEPKR